MKHCLRIIILFIVLTLQAVEAFSQPQYPGNQWINYNQKYYRLYVVNEGIYRIGFNALQQAGVPVASINPRNFQLFTKGREVAIHVQGEMDNVFDPADFIEFYAKGNDAWLDSLVYDQPSSMGNPYYSLFNDTAAYYLTWNNSLSNRRMITETDTVNFGLYNQEPFAWFESLNVFSNSYYTGKTTTIATTDPEYTEAEGWFSTSYTNSTTRTDNITVRSVFTGGPQATFSTWVVGASQNLTLPSDQRVRIFLNQVNGPLLADVTFDGYTIQRITVPLNNAQLTSPVTPIVYQSVNTATVHSGRQAVAFNMIRYPHNLDIDNANTFACKLPPNISQLKSRVEIQNPATGSPYWFYDLTNSRRIPTVRSGNTIRLLTPNFGNEKECFLAQSSSFVQVTNLTPINGTGDFTNLSVLLNSNIRYLIISHPELWSGASAYSSYRNTTGHSNLLLDVNELYDQFAYGIRRHPFAIRGLSAYALQQPDNAVEHLFLIGKALSADQVRRGNLIPQSLVPTFGYPPSDILLTARVPGTIDYEPGIPVGRIAARNNTEVQNYLNKVIQYESHPAAMWMKEILHFAGGNNGGEQLQLKYYLSQYEQMLEDTLFGGNVTTFSKTSSAPFQITASDSIRNIIQSGVSMMNFFGHAASSGFDVNLDDPSTYNWNGKYPFLVGNSCFVGDIHLPAGQSISVSENFTLRPYMGTIGFLAQVGAGLPPVIYTYTSAFMRHVSQLSYGKSVGYQIQQAIKSTQVSTYDLLKHTSLEMTLHGDPAVKIHSHEKPDYAITQAGVFFNPSVVSNNVDTFTVNVVVNNIGRAVKDTIILEVKRFLPDGSLQGIYSKVFRATYYRDTISLKIPVDLINGPGNNLLDIFVDAANKVDELSELNNRLQFNLLIRSEDVTPIHPYDYSIWPENRVTLMASTNDPLASLGNYRFQLDTTDLFSNPIATGIVNQSGGVVKWTPNITLQDSVVYFWRVSRDSSSGTSFRWRESSFQYIKNKTGWAQAHFFQFKNNRYRFIDYNRPQRKFNFVPNSRMLSVRTFSAPPGQRPTDTDLYAAGYQLDAEVQDYAGCTYTPAIHVAVIDSLTLESWGKYWVDNSVSPPVVYNPNHQFGNANNGSACRNAMERYFIFRTNNAAQMAGMKNMILNAVPAGHYIIAYTWVRGNFQNWADTSAISAFESLGADSLRYLPNHKGWIFFAKKGYPNTAQEVISPGAGFEEITFSTPLVSNWNEGQITSIPIGPAASWDSLHWRQNSLEIPSTDSIKLQLIGIRPNGVEDVLLNNIVPVQQYELSLQGIANAQTHPRMKLRALIRDDVNFTPAQLKRWQLTYKEIPEAAVNPNRHFSFHNTTVSEGEKVRMSAAIENVTRIPMDSLLVKFWIEDRNRNIISVSTPRLDSLKANDTLIAAVTVPTIGLVGNNKLWMEVNPINSATGQYDQPEQFRFNNFLSMPFTVVGDKINPLLDVTFDGVHIMDGDIISAKPNILIKLKDENKFRALDDTSLFAVYLKGPDDTEPQRLYFAHSNQYKMVFIPASLPDNKCKIELNPVFAKDGKYQLMVEAVDASRNKSGELNYLINFEIINRSTITEVMNYPNPFTTATRFVFTLTGSEIPDEFHIRIMTISGRIVREITKEELGPIRVGRNITEFVWDGTDQFGDRLANGIYLYKVFTSISGERIEKRSTEADDFFKKGWGKMVLMR
jgi:hypothetical protein